MPFPPEDLYQSPNRLAPFYSRFRVDRWPGEGHLLLTGHSHQAWPDCAREGLLEGYDDAARFVDKKWDRAFTKARRSTRIGDYFLRVFDHRLEQAVLAGDVSEARSLQLLRVRLMRTYSGLWLMVYRT